MRTGAEEAVDQEAIAIVGEAVRIARQRAALSQRALAARARVSQTAISRLERGRVRGMGLIYYARLVRVLGDAMPMVGCPHGHDCDYGRQWTLARRRLSADQSRSAAEYPGEGMTLFELMRQAERAGDLDDVG